MSGPSASGLRASFISIPSVRRRCAFLLHERAVRGIRSVDLSGWLTTADFSRLHVHTRVFLRPRVVAERGYPCPRRRCSFHTGTVSLAPVLVPAGATSTN